MNYFFGDPKYWGALAVVQSAPPPTPLIHP